MLHEEVMSEHGVCGVLTVLCLQGRSGKNNDDTFRMAGSHSHTYVTR